MITYENASNILLKRFPEIKSEVNFPDSPTLLFAEFSEIVASNFIQYNKGFIDRTVLLLNEICNSQLVEVQALISEFVITLYDKNRNECFFLIQLVSEQAARVFIENIDLWLRNN